LPILAVVVGFATATRPVGVALLPALAWHIAVGVATWRGRLWRWLIYLPIGCWGLAAFMAYQWFAFDDPLAFARTQAHWRVRPATGPTGPSEHAVALLTLEPLWSVADPSSPCCWRHHEPETNPLFSLHLANPIYFVFTVALVAVGGCKRWLSREEVLLAAGLLLIPYLTRSHEMCMGSMGRFSATVFPAYLVLGQLLARLPAPAAALVLVFSGLFLAAYSALFAAWHRLF
jgi:hypothetical protein